MNINVTLEAIRRAQILDAAIRTIAEQGADSVTLENIAKAAGLSKGGIIHYFANKELLFREAFSQFFDRIFRRSKETMDQFENPLDRILAFEWLFDRTDPEIELGYPLLFDCMVRVVRDPAYRSLFHDWVDGWVTLLTDALNEGVQRGVINVSDIDATARTISAIYHGIATRWYLDPESHSNEWALRSFRLAITALLSDQLVGQPTGISLQKGVTNANL
ncbi:MAG: TetR/AcrR family transcriptional regulator [Deltaproteobacteria bacterium]|nr:TetR/AcrR family transcriptional regulator [Deltaproteobacteria bacterium]